MYPTLLLTRSEKNARRVLNALAPRLGTVPHVIAPLFHIVDVPAHTPTETEVILTSPEGARRAVQMGVTGRAWCVGDSTAAVAKDGGFDLQVAQGDGASLLAMITQNPPILPMVHICGRHQSVDFVAGLAPRGIACRAVVTYDQVAQPLSDAARNILKGEGAVVLPLFSPRTNRILQSENVAINAQVTYVAISAAAGRGLENVRIAAQPSFDAMIDTIGAAMLHPVAS